VSDGCKVNNALIVYEDAKIRARGARTLAACANSLTCPRAKFRFNQCEEMP